MTASACVPSIPDFASRPQRPGRRAENKARTRHKVLQSAKKMFMARGYEGATMRDIAADAGLSTGALFANFADKADLFNEVVLTDFQSQREQMDAALEGAASAQDRVKALLGAGYWFHSSQLPLLRAAISVSWSHGLAGELGERPISRAVTRLLADILEEGAAKGEFMAGFDRELIAEMLWDSYLANYRWAIFAGWDPAALNKRLGRQIEVLLAPLRR